MLIIINYCCISDACICNMLTRFLSLIFVLFIIVYDVLYCDELKRLLDGCK